MPHVICGRNCCAALPRPYTCCRFATGSPKCTAHSRPKPPVASLACACGRDAGAALPRGHWIYYRCSPVTSVWNISTSGTWPIYAAGAYACRRPSVPSYMCCEGHGLFAWSSLRCSKRILLHNDVGLVCIMYLSLPAWCQVHDASSLTREWSSEGIWAPGHVARPAASC